MHRHCKFITATTKFSAEDTTSYYRDMKAFLEHPNVDVNLLTGDTEGLAAIHLAMDSRNYELIKLFLECDRVDVNIKSKRVSSFCFVIFCTVKPAWCVHSFIYFYCHFCFVVMTVWL